MYKVQSKGNKCMFIDCTQCIISPSSRHLSEGEWLHLSAPLTSMIRCIVKELDRWNLDLKADYIVNCVTYRRSSN